MNTEELRSLTGAESESMCSLKEQLSDSFRTSKDYRHAFLEESISCGLAAQIKLIREQRKESQASFARALGKTQSWISRLEDPNEGIPTISTLLTVARAFDVCLEVRFISFSHLINRLDRQSAESLVVPSFDEDEELNNPVATHGKTATFGAETPRTSKLCVQMTPSKPAYSAGVSTKKIEIGRDDTATKKGPLRETSGAFSAWRTMEAWDGQQVTIGSGTS